MVYSERLSMAYFFVGVIFCSVRIQNLEIIFVRVVFKQFSLQFQIIMNVKSDHRHVEILELLRKPNVLPPKVEALFVSTEIYLRFGSGYTDGAGMLLEWRRTIGATFKVSPNTNDILTYLRENNGSGQIHGMVRAAELIFAYTESLNQTAGSEALSDRVINLEEHACNCLIILLTCVYFYSI